MPEKQLGHWWVWKAWQDIENLIRPYKTKKTSKNKQNEKTDMPTQGSFNFKFLISSPACNLESSFNMTYWRMSPFHFFNRQKEGQSKCPRQNNILQDIIKK